MSTVGAAAKSAENSWHVESIAAHGHVMMVLVGHAKYVFLHDATVARFRKTYCVVTDQTKSRANSTTSQLTVPLPWRSGLAHSNVQTSVVGRSIVESTLARSPVISRMRSHHIVLDLPTSSPTAHVVRLC
jgi:hypothetical protein